MVDPLGKTPVVKNERIAPVARPTPVVAAPDVTPRAVETAAVTVAQSSLASTAKELSAKPPVDLDRVARIRKAIADGSFPINPAKIADRLIALKMDWTPNEPA